MQPLLHVHIVMVQEKLKINQRGRFKWSNKKLKQLVNIPAGVEEGMQK